MARKKKVVEEVKEEAVVETAEEVKEEKPKATKVEEVTVLFNGTSRVYSKKLHGEDFMKLAEGFAKKTEGKLV